MAFSTRCEMLGEYILEYRTTIRKTAEKFNLSKSTVHNDLSKRLKTSNYALYLKVKKLLKYNFSCKHIRGGNSTKLKYKKMA